MARQSRARVPALSGAGAAAASDLLGRLCCAPDPCLALPGGVSLGFVPLHALARWSRELRWLLDRQEVARAGAIRHPRRALSFWGGRTVAKLMLSRASGGDVPPEAWQIVPRASGKPHAHPGRFGISIAHTDELLGVAVSSRGEIGLDFEPLGVPSLAIPLEHLHPAERRRLQALSPSERSGALLRLWTVKEAVVKCRGTGVGADLSAIDASAALPSSASFRVDECHVAAQRTSLDGGCFSVALAGLAAVGIEGADRWR